MKAMFEGPETSVAVSTDARYAASGGRTAAQGLAMMAQAAPPITLHKPLRPLLAASFYPKALAEGFLRF